MEDDENSADAITFDSAKVFDSVFLNKFILRIKYYNIEKFIQ